MFCNFFQFTAELSSIDLCFATVVERFRVLARTSQTIDVTVIIV
jgi:hypothetical protein